MWTSTFSFWKITRLRGQAKTKLELLSIMWHNMPLCWYFGLSKHIFIPSTTSKHFRRLMPRSRDETMSSRRDRISKSTETCNASNFANRRTFESQQILYLKFADFAGSVMMVKGSLSLSGGTFSALFDCYLGRPDCVVSYSILHSVFATYKLCKCFWWGHLCFSVHGNKSSVKRA